LFLQNPGCVNDKEMQQKWRYFLRNMKTKELAFQEIMLSIDMFLRPLWDAIINEDEWLFPQTRKTRVS